MSAGSGNFQHEVESSLLAQTTHFAASGNFQHIATGRLFFKESIPVAGSGAFQHEVVATLSVRTDPIPAGRERWDTPRYRFVGG
jgi:hypothetical protein